MSAISTLLDTFRAEHRRIAADSPYLPLDLVGRLAWGKVSDGLAYRIAHREAWGLWGIHDDREEWLDLFRRVEEFRQVRTMRSIDRLELASAVTV